MVTAIMHRRSRAPRHLTIIIIFENTAKEHAICRHHYLAFISSRIHYLSLFTAYFPVKCVFFDMLTTSTRLPAYLRLFTEEVDIAIRCHDAQCRPWPPLVTAARRHGAYFQGGGLRQLAPASLSRRSAGRHRRRVRR